MVGGKDVRRTVGEVVEGVCGVAGNVVDEVGRRTGFKLGERDGGRAGSEKEEGEGSFLKHGWQIRRWGARRGWTKGTKERSKKVEKQKQERKKPSQLNPAAPKDPGNGGEDSHSHLELRGDQTLCSQASSRPLRWNRLIGRIEN
jgi:hypothetical protein